MKKTIKFTMLGAALIGAAPFIAPQAHAAAVLSMNFVDNSGGTSAYTGGGVLDASSRLWDTLTGGSAGGGGGFSASTTVGGITVSVPDYGDFSSLTTPTLDLFDGYVYSGTTNGGAEFIRLSGLDTAQTYDLAVYAAWGFGAIANSFNVTDLSGTSANQNTTGTNTSSFQQGSNYVIFSGLKPTALGEITLNIAGGAADQTQWAVSGLELTAVPEPSVALLGGLSALALLRRRRN